MTEAVHMVPVYEKDLKAVWRLLVERNPETENAAIAQAAVPEADPPADPPAKVSETSRRPGWTDLKLEELYVKFQSIHRAFFNCLAEAGLKGKSSPYPEFFAAAKVGWEKEHEGEGPFTDRTLSYSGYTWITKYSHMVGQNGDWPTTEFNKGDVLHFQMDPATAKTILRLRDKFSA